MTYGVTMTNLNQTSFIQKKDKKKKSLMEQF